MPDKIICFDEFLLDFNRFQLFRAAKPVHLEGLPLEALMFLVENKGQLVTREQLANRLWGKDVFVDVEQGINTIIRKIRLALEDDANSPRYLQTVVGRGYRFVCPDESGLGLGSPTGFVSAEELGQAIMSAAGLDPLNPSGPAKNDKS